MKNSFVKHALSYAGFALEAAREVAPNMKPKKDRGNHEYLNPFERAARDFDAHARKLTKRG
jgi:hypothetical protein